MLDTVLAVALPLTIPKVGGFVGIIGGTIGAISGIAGFSRRRTKLSATLTENADGHSEWYTIAISNRSDLSFSYQSCAVAWFIATPLGEHRLNWAYSPDYEADITTIAAHGVSRLRVGEQDWSLAQPKERRGTAFLRIYLETPARGGGFWLRVRDKHWPDDSLRERFLNQLYNVNKA